MRAVAEQPGPGFAGLLRQLRAEARLTQEELAEAARLSPRSVSDLERGIHRTAHRDTAGLLADALGLAEPVRALFVAAARGRGPAAEVLAARQGYAPGAFQAAPPRTLPRDIAAFTGRQAELAQLMPPGEAASLLVRLAGRAGPSPADPAVREITRLCGYLPLAIGMLARQLHHHPAWSVAGRAAELAAAVDRLELMATENLSVAAAFDLSYADLTPDQQRLFRRLGLHPGTDIDGFAAAALDGTGLAIASPPASPPCCATTARGLRPSPATPPPCAPHSTWATGLARPMPLST